MQPPGISFQEPPDSRGIIPVAPLRNSDIKVISHFGTMKKAKWYHTAGLKIASRSCFI